MESRQPLPTRLADIQVRRVRSAILTNEKKGT